MDSDPITHLPIQTYSTYVHTYVHVPVLLRHRGPRAPMHIAHPCQKQLACSNACQFVLANSRARVFGSRRLLACEPASSCTYSSLPMSSIVCLVSLRALTGNLTSSSHFFRYIEDLCFLTRKLDDFARSLDQKVCILMVETTHTRGDPRTRRLLIFSRKKSMFSLVRSVKKYAF